MSETSVVERVSMAKKKSVRKAKAKKGGSKKAVKRINRSKRASGPRSVPLPGMEQVRNAKLDNLCEAISETRTAINDLRATEAGNEQAALKVMQAADCRTYKHAGVELLRVPGDEKLRVRTSKESASSEVVEEVESGEESGERAEGIAG
jgi:hypothetical protein